MNILFEQLPLELDVEGQSYRIDPDFRNCLRIVTAFEDPELARVEKQMVLFENLFVEKPENINAGIQRAIWFLNGGKDGPLEEEGPRVFSFEKDAPLVYAAFHQTHGVDLQTAQMHWWKFMALFMDLGADTVFCNLISLRRKVKTGKATKEERAAARDMGDLFVVPDDDDRTIEEREAERAFMDALAGGKGQA